MHSSWTTFIIFKQIRGRLAYRYPRTIEMPNKLEIYIITIKYCTLQQNFSISHFSKQNMIENYKNIWLIYQISMFTNPSSAVICRYGTRFKKLLFQKASLFMLFVRPNNSFSCSWCRHPRKIKSRFYNLFIHLCSQNIYANKSD